MAEARDTRQRILEAALRHFAEEGYAGARTQSIADSAEVNKAMLYYHFRDKDHLYRESLLHLFSRIAERVLPALILQGATARERIRGTVDAYGQLLLSEPHLRAIMLRELASGGAVLREVVAEARDALPGLMPQRVFTSIRTMMESGEIREGDERQVFLHIISLAVFPHLARPVLEAVLGLTTEESAALLAERTGAVSMLLEFGLFTSEEGS